jgi:D-threo-aldose 1-dehydrogenase
MNDADINAEQAELTWGGTVIDPLARRAIGKTALRVSRLGVGGGSTFGRAQDGTSLLDTCWDAGLRYFDSAPLYGAGESERRFGAFLASKPRETFVLSTKVGRMGPTQFDYSADAIQRALRGSHERLGLSRIDLVFIHDLDPDLLGDAFERQFDQAVNEAAPALLALRDSGAIAAFGVGVKNWDVCLRFARAVPVDCFMLAGGYTLLQHGALAELLPYCVMHDISVIVAAPFNTGILATGAIEGARYYYEPADAEVLARTRQLETICGRHGVGLAAAALQFPLLHPAVASIVVGHESFEQVEQNLRMLCQPIPRALWAEMKVEGLLPGHAPT